jgi:hypothetical protein
VKILPIPNLTLIRAAIKKCIEWLQVQIAFLTEVNLAPSRPDSHAKNMDCGQINVARGLICWLPFDERITLENLSILLK